MIKNLSVNDLTIDKEFQELLPPLTPDEYGKLEQSILAYGVQDPIKVWCPPDGNNIIIDGHNRYRVLEENNLSTSSFRIMSELKTREDVKEWMMEQQLGRRNLSDVEKYEIVQRFKTLIQNKAKQNNSDGGKGLSTLTKVDTRKEMAKMVGVSTGTYSKLDKVMQSDNEEVKQKLRKKEISTNKAFKVVNDVPTKTKPEIRTPQLQIEEMDTRISEIEKEEQRLQQEKENILKRRKFVFESLDIQCPVKYRWKNSTLICLGWDVVIYEELDGKENILYEGFILSEIPDEVWTQRLPNKLKANFLMVWTKAHQEYINEKAKYEKELNKAWARLENTPETTNNPLMNELLKAGYRTLSNKYHPDNGGGDIEKMKELNKLKEELSI